ncbi:hypothetical protein [Streptomyces sp. NBC_01615]|uniref:hypothetical protein n=1 Tax=Streptomyces sp. NBC_01615 TaxID=2975898 RepID=UPI003863C7A7
MAERAVSRWERDEAATAATRARPPVSEDQLQAVLEAHPDLDANGYPGWRVHSNRRGQLPHPTHERDRAALLASLDDVDRASRWIRSIAWTSKVSKSAMTSYGLKHVVEAMPGELGGYLTNGAFIAACLVDDVPLKFEDSPNPVVGLDVRTVNDARSRNS